MSGCSGGILGLGFRVLGGVELNDKETVFSARFELVSFRDVTIRSSQMGISTPYPFEMDISITYPFITDVDLGNGFRYPVAT